MQRGGPLSKRGADLLRRNKPLVQTRLMEGISLLSPMERRESLGLLARRWKQAFKEKRRP